MDGLIEWPFAEFQLRKFGLVAWSRNTTRRFCFRIGLVFLGVGVLSSFWKLLRASSSLAWNIFTFLFVFFLWTSKVVILS